MRIRGQWTPVSGTRHRRNLRPTYAVQHLTKYTAVEAWSLAFIGCSYDERRNVPIGVLLIGMSRKHSSFPPRCDCRRVLTWKGWKSVRGDSHHFLKRGGVLSHTDSKATHRDVLDGTTTSELEPLLSNEALCHIRRHVRVASSELHRNLREAFLSQTIDQRNQK